jgi:hypothetical protein
VDGKTATYVAVWYMRVYSKIDISSYIIDKYFSWHIFCCIIVKDIAAEKITVQKNNETGHNKKNVRITHSRHR